MTRHRASALLIAVLLGAPGAFAQDASVQVPAQQALAPRLASSATVPGPLTLDESVRLTILNSPAVAAQSQTVQRALGRAQRSKGQFDSSLRIAPGLFFDQTQILPAFKGSEENNRLLLSITADVFRDLFRTFKDAFDSATTTPPPCPPSFGNFGPQQNTSTVFLTDGRDEKELEFLGIDQDVFFALGGDLAFLNRQLDLSNICGEDLGQRFEDQLLAQYLAPIDFSGGQGLQGVLTSTAQVRKEVYGLSSEIAEAVATRARLALERLGPVAADQLHRTFTLEAGYARRLRSGIGLSADLRLQTDEQAYRDKVLDPAFGGLAIPNSFPSSASLTFTMPFSRGRGAAGNTAAERSSEISVTVERDRLRHAIVEESYRAVLAHLNVIGAQETLKLIEESAARQARLAELTQAQVDAGDLPRIDADRVRARVAAVAAGLAGARSDVIDARLSLAQTIGLDVPAGAQAPPVVDGFAQVMPVAPALEAWLASAGQRYDVRAAERQVAASSVLVEGASADTRQRFDLSINGGLSNRYESPFFRYLPDEQFPIYSDFETAPDVESATRWYSPRGIYRSFTGRWEPFVSATFTVEFTLGNHTAYGRLAQAQATERQSRIQAGDLGRVARANVVSVSGSLERVQQAVGRRRTAVERSEAALQGTFEQLKAGEATIIDTLTTEESLTRDKLDLVRELLNYFSTFARLKFEAGDLVKFANEEIPVRTGDVRLGGTRRALTWRRPPVAAAAPLPRFQDHG